MKFRSTTRPDIAARGFGVAAALFILVGLGGLATAIVAISTGQQRGLAFDVQGTKAYQAARAGAEYGLRVALNFASAGFGSAQCGSTSFALTGNLNGYSVKVECASNTFSESSTTVIQYEITATACNRASCPGTADATYVERQLRVSSATNPP
jgi:MSHA biogenesis protein MshP